MNKIKRDKTQPACGKVAISSDLKYLRAALSYSEQIAFVLGLASKEQKNLCIAIEEVIADVINNSFSSNKKNMIELEFFESLNGVEVHISDQGTFYNPNLIPDYNPHAGLEQNFDGLGTFLAKNLVDSYQLGNLGAKGKRVVLRKFIASEKVLGRTVKKVDVSGQASTNLNDVVIRWIKGDEAESVCKKIFDSCEFSSKNEYLYYPSRFAAMNSEGKINSMIALADNGEVAGHFAIVYHEFLPPEGGTAVTVKKYRGLGVGRKLGASVIAEAKKSRLPGMHMKVEAVEKSNLSFCHKLGYKDCGVLLQHFIPDASQQRISSVITYNAFEKFLYSEIYVPDRHKVMIQKLFRHVGVDVKSLHNPSNYIPKKMKSSLIVNVDPKNSRAEVCIIEYGQDIVHVIQYELEKIFRDQINVIEFYLPVENPTGSKLMDKLEDIGFIFVGVMPATEGGNCVILQFLNGVEPEFEALGQKSAIIDDLINYIRKNLK